MSSDEMMQIIREHQKAAESAYMTRTKFLQSNSVKVHEERGAWLALSNLIKDIEEKNNSIMQES